MTIRKSHVTAFIIVAPFVLFFISGWLLHELFAASDTVYALYSEIIPSVTPMHLLALVPSLIALAYGPYTAKRKIIAAPIIILCGPPLLTSMMILGYWIDSYLTYA